MHFNFQRVRSHGFCRSAAISKVSSADIQTSIDAYSTMAHNFKCLNVKSVKKKINLVAMNI